MDHTYLRRITLRSGELHQVTAEDLRHLEARICVDPATDCWNWTANRTPPGYGKVAIVPGMEEYTHRVMFMLAGGVLEHGMHLDHLCRNTSCCNPDHLEQVTSRENTLRSPIAPAAINARKTHCNAGHEFTEANTRRNGHTRACRACGRERTRASQPPAQRRQRRHEARAAAVEAAGGACLHESASGRQCTLPIGHGGRHDSTIPLPATADAE